MTLLSAADLLPDLDLSILHPTSLERRTVKIEIFSLDLNDFEAARTKTLRDVIAKWNANSAAPVSIDDILDAILDTDDDGYATNAFVFYREEPEADRAFSERIQQTYNQRKASLDRKIKDDQRKAKKKDNDRIVSLTTKVLNNTATPEEKREVFSRLMRADEN